MSAGEQVLAVPDGPGWPLRLATNVLNPGGTRGRALLLHGLGSDGNTWWWFSSRLADLGYLVVAPDLRSHGASPTAIDHRIATLAADVAILGDGWDLVVGNSLGGAVAAELLGRPHLEITAAVLVDPVLRLAAADRAMLRVEQRADTGDIGTHDEVAAANPRWHPRDVERKRLAAAAVTPGVVDLVLDHNDPWDVLDTVDRWRARVEVLASDPDCGALLTPDVVAELPVGERLRVTTVAGVGHGIQREDRDAVWAAIARVLDLPT